MRIEYEKNAVKFIEAQDKPTRQRLKKVIEKIPAGDIVKLQGTQNYRLRVGQIRIIFSIDTDVIVIKNADSRGQVYKRI